MSKKVGDVRMPSLRSILAAGDSIMGKFSQQGWQKLAAQLKRWEPAGLVISGKYMPEIKAEELDKGFRKTGNPDFTIKITSPLTIDKEGLHGVFQVSPQDLARVQYTISPDSPYVDGKILRVVFFLKENGKPGFTFPPKLIQIDSDGEVKLNIKMDELNTVPPSRPLPLQEAKLWPVGAYKIHIVQSDFVPKLAPAPLGDA